MRAFEFYNDFGDTEFKEDCEYIWNYLSDNGTINFPKRNLDRYYREFSNLHAAGWIDPKAEGFYWIEEFSEWLSEQEI